MPLAIADGDRAQILELARHTSAAFVHVHLHAGLAELRRSSPFTGQDTADVTDLSVRGRGLHSAASSHGSLDGRSCRGPRGTASGGELEEEEKCLRFLLHSLQS
jgi:hypothetical protein